MSRLLRRRRQSALVRWSRQARALDGGMCTEYRYVSCPFSRFPRCFSFRTMHPCLSFSFPSCSSSTVRLGVTGFFAFALRPRHPLLHLEVARRVVPCRHAGVWWCCRGLPSPLLLCAPKSCRSSPRRRMRRDGTSYGMERVKLAAAGGRKSDLSWEQ
ncbi:hypothetical protein C8R45DRAFT_515452 [Mycena sanguinolenta]|nr:hypothetical protein C8R45DRAFT_515452 [Mycena sanguinolenta]